MSCRNKGAYNVSGDQATVFKLAEFFSVRPDRRVRRAYRSKYAGMWHSTTDIQNKSRLYAADDLLCTSGFDRFLKLTFQGIASENSGKPLQNMAGSGAGSGARTRTTNRSTDFKSVASASSAIPAYWPLSRPVMWVIPVPCARRGGRCGPRCAAFC